MARPCSICGHDEREAINRAIVERETSSAITRRFAVSADAIHRHKINHLAETMREVERARQAVKATEAGKVLETSALVEGAAAGQAREVRATSTLLERLFELMAETREILREARACPPNPFNPLAGQELALKAIARCEKQWELEAKLVGEIKDAGVNITVNQGADTALLARLIEWLAPYPEARQHIADCVQNEFGDWEMPRK